MSLGEALHLAVEALSRESNGTERALTSDQLEVAVLDRTRPQQRKFKRVLGRQLARLLGDGPGGDSAAPDTAESEDGPEGSAGESTES
jgi:proteasome alpha subunit